MKLRYRLGLGFALAAALPALLVAGLHAVSYRRIAERASDTSNLAIVEDSAHALDDLLQNAARDVRGFAIPALPPDGDRDALARRLAAYTYTYPYFREILWVSLRGKVLTSSNIAHHGQALTSLHEELADNLADALREPAGVLHISDFDDTAPEARTAGKPQEALTLHFLLRVEAEHGQGSGVLIATLNNQALVAALQDLQQHLPDGAPVVVLNRRGDILLSSDPRALPFQRHALAERVEQILNASGRRSAYFDHTVDGKEHEFIVAETPGIGLAHAASWRVLATHSEDSIRAPIRHTLYQTLALLAAIIGVAGLFGLWLARSISRPIEALSATAARIGGGDLTARAPSASDDEIGDMGRTFNAMAGMVERERGELDRKVVERTAELEQATREVEQASRGKDEFLAAISHELKTPLNHILGFADLLKEGLAGELNAEQKGMAQDIFDAGNRQLAIVNALIELARLQAGKVELETEPQDPAWLLGEIAALNTERARATGLTFSADIAQGMGEMPLDRRVVTRILDQLLANAFKFTPAGGAVRLVARRVPRSEVAAPVRRETAEYLELAVVDNGPGIAPETLSRLFQPFVQGSGGLSRSHQGIGVGLALVKLLAELHGGGCGIESTPGADTKFLVWLPC